MINRKQLKKDARNNIKHHYFRNIILTFICSVLLAGGFNYTTRNIISIDVTDAKVNKILNNKNLTSSEIIDELLEKTTTEKKIEADIKTKYTKGVISYLLNETISSRSIIFTILNNINKLLFADKIGTNIIIITSSILLTIISILFINAIEVGKNRYFLEERRYYDTKIDKLLFPYKIKKTFHIAYILFLKSVYQFLWSLTIIGGIIKYYEYKMIPYLLAENPKLTKKEAFKLSKELSQNHKLQLFYLDISMLGWYLLKICTFNLSGIFYSDAYKESLYAEVYMNLRKNSSSQLLNDSYLDIPTAAETAYPEEKFSIAISKSRKWLNVDYAKDYSTTTYILLFFTFSIIGWLWEVLLHLINQGEFVNRGTMYGPWLPIYGFGGVAILILLKKFRDKPFQLFISAFILCGIVEYGTAWYLETFKHLKYWDYTGYFFNIQGRVCLEGLIVFGLGGCGFTYIVAPILDNLYQKISPSITKKVASILLILFIADFIYATITPNTGEGISKSLSLNIISIIKIQDI